MSICVGRLSQYLNIDLISSFHLKFIGKSIFKFISNGLKKKQRDFGPGYSTQHNLLVMIEKWKESVNGGPNGILMTDFSKPFYCFNYDLFIAKLDAYGFDNKALAFVYSYRC